MFISSHGEKKKRKRTASLLCGREEEKRKTNWTTDSPQAMGQSDCVFEYLCVSVHVCVCVCLFKFQVILVQISSWNLLLSKKTVREGQRRILSSKSPLTLCHLASFPFFLLFFSFPFAPVTTRVNFALLTGEKKSERGRGKTFLP